MMQEDKMTLRGVYELSNALMAVSDLPGVKFAYAIARNRSKADSIIAFYDKKFHAPHEKEHEFQEARVKLCERFCTKDENGAPMLQNGMYQGLKGNPGFDIAIEGLKSEYKEFMDFKEEQQRQFNIALDSELEESPTFYKVRFEDIPSQITATQLTGLLPLILNPPE